MIKKYSIICWFLFTSSLLSSAQDVNTMLKAGYTNITNAQEPEALEQFLDVLKADANNYEATWNASLLYSKIGNRMKDEDQQKSYFNLARQYAQKALKIDSSDVESNYVMAVAMGRMALISGAHDKVAAARDIKKYADAALKFNPQHAGAWYVLGVWNYDVANLNFFERAAANMLFGGLPDGKVANAITDYKKAIQFDPTYILYWKALGVAYDNIDQKDNAIAALKTALSLKQRTADDPEHIKEAQDLLKKLQ
jgi:tetratricopeptide (TPR) repeat protein